MPVANSLAHIFNQLNFFLPTLSLFGKLRILAAIKSLPQAVVQFYTTKLVGEYLGQRTGHHPSRPQ